MPTSRYNPRPRTQRRRPDDDDELDETPAPPREVDETSEDPAEREIRARVVDRAEAHWHTWHCEAGHVFESHRTTSSIDDATMPCIICRRPATYESPDATVRREWAQEHSPVALVRLWAETLTEWAQMQLNAQTWTERSRQQRQAAHRRQVAQRDKHEHLTASADVFPPDF